MNKTPFKPIFNNPLKKSISPPEREIPTREHGDRTQVDSMEAVAPGQASRPEIEKAESDNCRKLGQSLKKKQNKEDRRKPPMTSLTDAEYNEIFSLAINRVMTGGVPSTGYSDTEDAIEARAVIPKANEAFPPQEAAVGPMECNGRQFKARKTFSKLETSAPHSNAKACVSQHTPTKGSSETKQRNSKDALWVVRQSKAPLPNRKPDLAPLPALPKKQKVDQGCKQHSNAYQNFKPVCKDTEMKAKQDNQSAKLQATSTSVSAERRESMASDPSRSVQHHRGDHSKHSTQCSHYSQKCAHVCDSTQSSVMCKSVAHSQSSQALLSQPAPGLSLKERLLWLRQRRDVGLWVQCCRATCKKWRYLQDVRDPVEVPEEWFCHMNSDQTHNSCAAPEKPPTPIEEEDFIHNSYTAGSVVWGRLAGYPWWPAMVDDDPDTEQYYWLNGFSDIPTHYHVVFFDEQDVTRAWLTSGAMRPFTGCELRTTTAHELDYAKRLQVAKLQAQKALSMGIGQRLKTFGFLACFKGPIGSIKRNKGQGKRKADQYAEIFSQNSGKGGAFSAHRKLQEDGGKEKPKGKRAKPESVAECATKKTKVQTADNEGGALMSEATDSIKIHKVQEHSPSVRQNQSIFSGSLYTQELSGKVTDSLKERHDAETSSATHPENVSTPESSKSIKNNKDKGMINEIEVPSGSDSRKQSDVTAQQGNTTINCSQDMFSSQTAYTELNASAQTYAHIDVENRTDAGSHRQPSPSSGNVRHEQSKMSECTEQSVGENCESGQIQTAELGNRSLDIVAGTIVTDDGANRKTVTHAQGSASVLQPDIHNASTSSAPTGSHSHCSDNVSLVPDIGHSNVQTRTNQTCDAVVPQLGDGDGSSDDNSCNSPDFEPEE